MLYVYVILLIGEILNYEVRIMLMKAQILQFTRQSLFFQIFVKPVIIHCANFNRHQCIKGNVKM